MMPTLSSPARLTSSLAALVLTVATGTAFAADLMLSGANEVPPVTTSAAGSGTIDIAPDGAVTGSVKTTGIKGTMAHIHRGAPGKNGPVLVPLAAGSDGEWKVPAGAKLDADGLKAYQAGELYVNVHSDANKGGEIRAQLKP